MVVCLNDYLYGGHTVPKIVSDYGYALRVSAIKENNPVDLAHSSFILGYLEFLENNEFIATQANILSEFYKYLEKNYSFLSFTFKGRIKTLVRLEEKYNSYVMKYVCKFYKEHHTFPSAELIVDYLKRYRDILAYRFVINMPKCYLTSSEPKEEVEKKLLYEICNKIPGFLQERGFDILDLSHLEDDGSDVEKSPLLNENLSRVVKDYVLNPKPSGYQALHLYLYDNFSRCLIEIQLRTKQMDDFAEIGPANHTTYEEIQRSMRTRRENIPEGQCQFFDDAFARLEKLNSLDLKAVDVDMFTASETLTNDQAGFAKQSRLIVAREHLSRYQQQL